MRTSYNGWPASPNRHEIGIVPLEVLGHSFPGGVKGGDVELIFRTFLTRYDREVESLTSPGPDDEWGYWDRPNRNDTSTTSCHGSGTAVDVNAQTHPNGRRNTLTPAKVARLRQLLAYFDGVIKWGGDFRGTPDEMHYEINRPPADPAVAHIAAKIRADQARAAASAQPSTLTPDVQEDDMATVISPDGNAKYVVTARHGARHIANGRELRALVSAGVLTEEQTRRPIIVSQADLDALLAITS